MLEVQREAQNAARGGGNAAEMRAVSAASGRRDERPGLARNGSDARRPGDSNGKGKSREMQHVWPDRERDRHARPSERDASGSRSAPRKRPKSPSPSDSDSDDIDSDDLDGEARRRQRDDERRRKRAREGERGSGGGGGGSILAKLGLDVNELFGRKGSDRWARCGLSKGLHADALPRRPRRDYDSDNSSDMEADAATIAREEARAARLAREADRREEAEEARRAEEKRRRRMELARRA